MDQPASGKMNVTAFGWWWIGGIALIVIASFVTGWCRDATELTPSHGDFSIPAGLVAGVLTLIVVFSQSSQANLLRRFSTALVIAFMATGSTFYLIYTVTDLLNMRADFPPDRMRTYQDFVQIRRAYQTHGKGTHSHIQTMPYWSDLDIDEQDFDFMRAHRRPGDPGTDRDEISSRGYFCAHVTMQQSGKALRILHTRGDLPVGTVVICPDQMPQ